jgi:tripartite-type tricarboxylate transporter receptor subunit TctC
MKRWNICILTALSAVLVAATDAQAAEADFYAGKTVSLIIGSGEGAGYDLSGRLIAQHLRRFLPGNPTVVPRNMPGASSVRAAEYLYNVAPRDGTTLGWFQPTIVTNKVTDPGAKYQPEKFGWIGRLASNVTVGIVWHTAPAQTVEEAKRTKVFIAANGPTGAAAIVPWMLNRMIGTKFEVVTGYDSGNAEGLALERGEAQGIGSTSWEFLDAKADWAREHKYRYLYTIDLVRHAKAPDAPSLLELAPTARDRDAMKLVGGVSGIGRSLVTTPSVPAERLAVLRQAFTAMLGDRQFLDDAAKRKVDIEPSPAAEVEKIVAEDIAMPPSVVERMKELGQPPG